jgi:hypothetical protein
MLLVNFVINEWHTMYIVPLHVTMEDNKVCYLVARVVKSRYEHGRTWNKTEFHNERKIIFILVQSIFVCVHEYTLYVTRLWQSLPGACWFLRNNVTLHHLTWFYGDKSVEPHRGVMVSVLLWSVMFSWICIVLAHWNNSLRIGMSPHLDTISCFRAN